MSAKLQQFTVDSVGAHRFVRLHLFEKLRDGFHILRGEGCRWELSTQNTLQRFRRRSPLCRNEHYCIIFIIIALYSRVYKSAYMFSYRYSHAGIAALPPAPGSNPRSAIHWWKLWNWFSSKFILNFLGLSVISVAGWHFVNQTFPRKQQWVNYI